MVEGHAMKETDQDSLPVPVEFTPKEFLELVETAIADGQENVHDFILQTAREGKPQAPPSNILPFPRPLD